MQRRRRPWTAPEILERVPRNPPAYGAWNGQKVVLGTGEGLLGPGSAAREAGPPITGEPGKWRAAERQSEGVVVAVKAGTTQPGSAKHPCFIDAGVRREGFW